MRAIKIDTNGNTCYHKIFFYCTTNNDKYGWNEDCEIEVF